MAEWIYFIHPPRENFAATMTAAEAAVWDAHWARLKRLHTDGLVILAGPTLGPHNTGIMVFEAPDEVAARTIMADDPIAVGGVGGSRTPTVPRLALARAPLGPLS